VNAEQFGIRHALPSVIWRYLASGTESSPRLATLVLHQLFAWIAAVGFSRTPAPLLGATNHLERTTSSTRSSSVDSRMVSLFRKIHETGSTDSVTTDAY
jgi:hypothetical protein